MHYNERKQRSIMALLWHRKGFEIELESLFGSSNLFWHRHLGLMSFSLGSTLLNFWQSFLKFPEIIDADLGLAVSSFV